MTVRAAGPAGPRAAGRQVLGWFVTPAPPRPAAVVDAELGAWPETPVVPLAPAPAAAGAPARIDPRTAGAPFAAVPVAAGAPLRIDAPAAAAPLGAAQAAAGTTTPRTAGLRVAGQLVDAFVAPAPAPTPPGGLEDAGPAGDDGAGPADGAPSGRRARRGRRSSGAGTARSGARGDAHLRPPTTDRPDDDGGPAADDVPPAVDAVAVLCRSHDALAVGGAVAAGRARRHALLVLWEAEALPAVCAPALPAATRLAATLRARGHAAVATGRLAVAVAPELSDVRRIAAVAGPAPVVVALAGPRDAAVDALLGEQDAVLVAGADGAALTELALEDLALTGIPARAVAVPAGARRVLAAAGLRAT